jgi:cytochrome c biogenesis protein CcmG, thiol:disulfide interchange protein DsbE
VTRRWLIVGLLVATCGCSSSHAAVNPARGGGSALAALITRAQLRPCPSSSTSAVANGLPNVTLSCLGHGPAVHMAGLTGRPTVVNIWGSWCEPCQAEESFLSAAYDKTHGRVRFLGVDTVDQADSALDFDAHVSPPVHFPSVFDPDRKVLIGLHFPGPPETLYVDSAGRIVHTNRVPYTSTAAVMADIAAYLHSPA